MDDYGTLFYAWPDMHIAGFLYVIPSHIALTDGLYINIEDKSFTEKIIVLFTKFCPGEDRAQDF